MLLLITPVQADLRDPTMPTGFYQLDDGSDMEMQQPRQLVLQAIFYNPKHPSVLINGQRYSTGDQIAGAEVKVIYADRVVLIDAGLEKELKLVLPSVKTKAVSDKGKNNE